MRFDTRAFKWWCSAMTLLIYCYNVTFVSLFVTAAVVGSMCYGQTKRQDILAIVCLMITLAIESFVDIGFGLVTDTFEPVFAFGDAKFVVFGAIVSLFYAGEIACALWLFRQLGILSSSLGMALVPALLAGRAIGLLAPDSFASKLLYLVVNDAIVVSMLVYMLAHWEKAEAPGADCGRLGACRALLRTSCVLIALAILQTALTFLNPSFSRIIPIFYERISPFEDAGWVLISVACILYARDVQKHASIDAIERIVQRRMDELEASMAKDSSDDVSSQMRRFCNRYKLTERESDVLLLAVQGLQNQEIASKLSISMGTVKVHMHNIFDKLGVSRRSQLLALFLQESGKMP